jgi:hypothetical protein
MDESARVPASKNQLHVPLNSTKVVEVPFWISIKYRALAARFFIWLLSLQRRLSERRLSERHLSERHLISLMESALSLLIRGSPSRVNP